MAADPTTDPGTVGQAVTTLLWWATPSGMIALIVGWLGYRRRARDEQQQSVNLIPQSSMALATLYSDRMAIDDVARATIRLATAMENQVRALEGLTRSIDDWAREQRLHTEQMSRLR